MAVFIRIVRLFDQLLVNIAPLFSVLQPSQIWIRLDHRVSCFTDGLLIDLLHINVKAIHRPDREVPFSDQFTFVDLGRNLMDMILLHRQFLALGQEVIFIGRRGDDDVLGGCNGDIALGIDLARDGVDVAT